MAKIQFSSQKRVFTNSGTYNKNWEPVLPTTEREWGGKMGSRVRYIGTHRYRRCKYVSYWFHFSGEPNLIQTLASVFFKAFPGLKSSAGIENLEPGSS